MSTQSTVQNILWKMSGQERMEINSNFFISPELKGKGNEAFKYKIPDIVLQQPNDWYFYKTINNKKAVSVLKYEELLESKKYNFYIEDGYLNTYIDHYATIQYQMLRFQTTTQKEKTPFEQLTEKVEQLTAELNDLKDMI